MCLVNDCSMQETQWRDRKGHQLKIGHKLWPAADSWGNSRSQNSHCHSGPTCSAWERVSQTLAMHGRATTMIRVSQERPNTLGNIRRDLWNCMRLIMGYFEGIVGRWRLYLGYLGERAKAVAGVKVDWGRAGMESWRGQTKRGQVQVSRGRPG